MWGFRVESPRWTRSSSEAGGGRGGRRAGAGRHAPGPGNGIDRRLFPAGAGGARALAAVRRDLGGNARSRVRARPRGGALRGNPRGAGPRRRRRRPGVAGPVAREGRRRRPHPREDRRRGRRRVRRRGVLGQARAPDRAAGAVGAAAVRTARDASPARAARPGCRPGGRPCVPRRKRHRRLSGSGRRPGGPGRSARRGSRRRRARAVPAVARVRGAGRPCGRNRRARPASPADPRGQTQFNTTSSATGTRTRSVPSTPAARSGGPPGPARGRRTGAA